MDGLLILDKPTGITSAKALYRVRSILHQRKSGHAGTLDPAATGVLILCLGKATRLVERIMGLPKVYHATARLDVTSSSFDSDRPLIPVRVESPPSPQSLASALAKFEGEIEQIPPAVSALKIGGRRAYRMDATTAEAQLKPRTALIYWLRAIRYAWPEVEFDMACGRGTYVRAIVRDLGAALGTGGCLTALRRTRIGPFAIEQSWSLERLVPADAADAVIPLGRAVELIEGQRQAPPRP